MTGRTRTPLTPCRTSTHGEWQADRLRASRPNSQARQGSSASTAALRSSERGEEKGHPALRARKEASA
jgi:hypothetical protein